MYRSQQLLMCRLFGQTPGLRWWILLLSHPAGCCRLCSNVTLPSPKLSCRKQREKKMHPPGRRSVNTSIPAGGGGPAPTPCPHAALCRALPLCNVHGHSRHYQMAPTRFTSFTLSSCTGAEPSATWASHGLSRSSHFNACTKFTLTVRLYQHFFFFFFCFFRLRLLLIWNCASTLASFHVT